MRHKLAIAFVIASTACITNIAYPADETQVVTFTLSHAASRDVATILRSIVGVKKFETADDHTLTVRDTLENLELAAAVVKMLDTTDDTADTTSLPAGDGSVIAAVVLDRASSKEVMDAVRRELRIARIATLGEKRILLRDTDSQIQAALEVIGRVEGNHEDPEVPCHVRKDGSSPVRAPLVGALPEGGHKGRPYGLSRESSSTGRTGKSDRFTSRSRAGG